MEQIRVALPVAAWGLHLISFPWSPHIVFAEIVTAHLLEGASIIDWTWMRARVDWNGTRGEV